MKKGILLVNLGTPDSPEPKDVRKYLIEFLLDGRVIDSATKGSRCASPHAAAFTISALTASALKKFALASKVLAKNSLV